MQPDVTIYTEICSVFENPPPDRRVLVELLLALQTGSVVVVACLSRLARLFEEQQAVLAAMAHLGAVVLTASVGCCVAAPLAVLAVPAGAAGWDLLSPTGQAALDGLHAVLPAVAVAAWAQSQEQALYTSEHALMQRVLVSASPAGGPWRRLMEMVCSSRRVTVVARTSVRLEHGGAQACAGGAAAGSMEVGSLSRQQGFCQWLLGG